MNETTQTASPSKTIIETVAMTDGSSVDFAGKRKMVKEVVINGKNVKINFYFRNGEIRSFTVGSDSPIFLNLVGHGASQKIGDSTSGIEDIEDMVVAVDSTIGILEQGLWRQEREGGGGFAGASVVIRALMEASGKTQEQIKSFLEAKIAATEGLTRAALYKSFRNPATAVGKIIARLEAEKAAKNNALDADDVLDELENI